MNILVSIRIKGSKHLWIWWVVHALSYTSNWIHLCHIFH